MAKFKTRKEMLSYDQPKLGILKAVQEVPEISGPLLGAGMGAGGKSSGKGFFESRRKGKTREEVERQGGPLNKKLSDTYLYKALEEHGLSPEYHENGGVTAYEFLGNNRQGNPMYKKKYFKTNTTLKTLRNWLGY